MIPDSECPIVYTECNYSGDSYEACEELPSVEIDVKSLYVPEGWCVTLFNDENYDGSKALHRESVPCFEEGV